MIDQRRRRLLDAAFRGGLGVALYVAFPAFSDVYRLWERSAGNPHYAAAGFEYPPISALYFWPLTFLPSSRWAVLTNGVVMVGAAVAITWLLTRRTIAVEGRGPDIGTWSTSPALMILLGVNWDVLVCLIAVAGMAALYENRQAKSGLWLGIGSAFKVFPGVMVPPMLPLLDGWKRRFGFLLSGGAALAASYGLYAMLKPDEWLFHLEFASQRADIDLTIWDLLDRALRPLDVSLSVGTVNAMSTVAISAAVLLTALWAARRRPDYVRITTIALIALLVFNKVFKPQYVIWVLPFLAWTGVRRWKVRALEAAVIAEFAAIYFPLPEWILPLSAFFGLCAFWVLAHEVITSPATSTPTQPFQA